VATSAYGVTAMADVAAMYRKSGNQAKAKTA